jgi:hypothetical protein
MVAEIRLKTVKGSKPLKGDDLKNFEIFLRQYADVIVQRWIDLFVLKKEIAFERITRKLK